MKKNKIRCTAAVLFLLMLLQAAVSCGQTGDPDTADSVAADTLFQETEELSTTKKDDLPEDINFDGETVTIYSRDHYRFNDEISVDELNGDIVNDAIFEREINVESRLNVNIENYREGDHHGSVDKLRTIVLAGDDTYDLFTASMYTVAPAATSGIFANLYNVEYIDLTKPYYTQDYVAKAQVGKGLYTITGDISLSLIRYSFCMYFNKNLVESFGLESPYDIVKSGAWTHDKLKSMISDVYVDLNGNGAEDDTDLYGLGTSNVIIVDAYCSSYEMAMFDQGGDGFPVMSVNVDRFVSAVEKIYNLNWETQGVRTYKEISDNNEMTDLCNYFSQDHLLFIHNWIYASETEYMRNMESDYGIIPYPKYDETQDSYYTFQHDQIGVFGIPVTSKKIDTAGAVLEAMSSESSNLVIPAYYDTALKGKYTRDPDSAEMIDIIHNNHFLDPAWIYCSYIGDLAQTPRNLMLSKSSDFSSYYAKRSKTYAKSLEKLIEKFTELESKN